MRLHPGIGIAIVAWTVMAISAHCLRGQVAPSLLASERASEIIGGACTDSFDLRVCGACTTCGGNNCISCGIFTATANCIGCCPFTCTPKTTYVTGTTYTQQNSFSNPCPPATSQTCTQIGSFFSNCTCMTPAVNQACNPPFLGIQNCGT